MKKLVVCWIFGCGFGRLVAAEPEAEARAAVNDLLNLSSYSWRRWTEPGSGSDSKIRAFPNMVMRGIADRDGWCIWTAEWYSTSVQGVFHGRNGAVNHGKGWKSWEVFRQEIPRLPRPANQQEGQEQLAIKVASFLVLVGFISPSEQLNNALAGVKNFSQGNGFIMADLTLANARTMLVQEGAEGMWSSNGINATNARGDVTWWIKDGHLVKFEVHLQGVLDPRIRGSAAYRAEITKITTFADHGTAELSLPKEAREALNQPGTEETAISGKASQSAVRPKRLISYPSASAATP